MKLRIAHSPDSDDAFMFYPMVFGLIDTEGFSFEHVLADIETLNRRAFEGTYEISAISFHTYPYVADKYLVLPSGGSVGDGYGPIVVSKKPLDTLKGKKVALPGRLTTAYLMLKLYEPDFYEEVLPFDQVMEAVEKGQVDAGLVIHEGQISYEDRGLLKFIDLGQWWKEKTGLPLPLGCNVVRKDLGVETIKKVERVMKRSLEYAISNQEKALEYAKNYARDIKDSQEKTKKFVSMYVNQRTVDYGEDGRQAVRLMLQWGKERGIIKAEVPKIIFSDEV